MNRHQHPIDEWNQLKDIPLPVESPIRFTRTKVVITGYDGVTLELQKSKKGVRFSFTGHTEDIKQDGEAWVYINERLTHREAFQLAKWIVGMDYREKDDE